MNTNETSHGDPFDKVPTYEPERPQFTLGDLFKWTTVCCMLAAILAACGVHDPWHWGGLLVFPALCLMFIAAVEGLRWLLMR